MKNLLSIFGILALFTLVWSCSEKDNLDPEKLDELSQPTLSTPANGGEIVLDQSTPDALIEFSWDKAVSTLGDPVTYKLVVDTLGSESFDSPILELDADNSGVATKASITQKYLDEVLSYAGYQVNSKVELTWAVIAKSLTKVTTVSATVSITRFENEIVPEALFISGEGTENGTDISKAIAMKRLNNTEGNPSNKYEIYTHLTADKGFSFYNKNEMPALNFGGNTGDEANKGTIERSANPISVAETAEYLIEVDLDNNTYSLTKIEKWSVVGSPIVGDWGGDEALEYQGAGIWKASIELVATGGFAFRANGDWGIMMKRVTGTENQLVLENKATEQGVEFEDVPSDQKGTYIFTLDLSADGYTYSIVKDPSAPEPITAPETLFLLADGTKLHELTKNGSTFSSDIYLALQAGVSYTLNTKEDGSGESYALESNIGITDNADGDKVSGSVNLLQGGNAIAVERDQAYQLSFDFETGKATWLYYNLKFFHWSDWDGRDEFEMTYSHPYQFSVTTDLKSGYTMKFNSPWDISFGGDDVSVLSGTMTNNGGEDISNISADGAFNVTITVADNYQTGTYEFVNQ